MSLARVPGVHGLWRFGAAPEKGMLGRLIRDFGARIIIGHPTFHNHDNIASELRRGILGAASVFKDKKTAFIISDGSLTEKDQDNRTIEAALRSAQETLDGLAPEEAGRIMVAALPYGGYDHNRVQGKGSALKVIFEEAAFTSMEVLILLDGDLRNDVAQWQAVYGKIMESHAVRFPGRPFFITARYARHFVDASITRFVVGPLTTLMGAYVPGGISGDIVLSPEAAALELKSPWSNARYRFGTDISTTFDNIAAGTVIYEVYLGAKLHDVTDDAKLSVMPGEVIGAALERLLHYEKNNGLVSTILESRNPVRNVIAWGPEQTGVGFINPGHTDVFNLAAKRASLAGRFDAFSASLEKVLRKKTFEEVEKRHGLLARALETGSPAPLFLDFKRHEWISALYECVGYVLATGDIEEGGRALNYLYTAAFLEFCAEKLSQLGFDTPAKIEAAQAKLGVEDARAEEFYNADVDGVVREMAMEFYSGRHAIAERMAELR